MSERSVLDESRLVLGEFIIYEFRMGTDACAVECFGELIQRMIDKEVQIGEKKSYASVFGKVSVVMENSDLVYPILSAGLRKSIQEVKKNVPAKKIIKLLPEIVELNKDFFAESPEMIQKIKMALIPDLPKTEADSTSSPKTESSTTKKT